MMMMIDKTHSCLER